MFIAVIRLVTSGKEIELEFDVLVLCSGRPYAAPIRPSSFSIPDRVNEINLFLSSLKLAVSMSNELSGIAVIGGGLVGVELVAEIADRMLYSKSKKRLVLVTKSK